MPIKGMMIGTQDLDCASDAPVGAALAAKNAKGANLLGWFIKTGISTRIKPLRAFGVIRG